MRLCRRGELAALWRSQGLRDVAEDALTIQTHFASFEDYCKKELHLKRETADKLTDPQIVAKVKEHYGIAR